MDKLRRQQLIRRIIGEKAISTQDDLMSELRKKGVAVTQATISRDIAEMALTKSRNLDGRFVYTGLEPASVSPAEKLARALREFGLTIDRSDNLVVVKTSPGAAQTVARCIDQTSSAAVVGTVAGDDTILIIARNKEKGRQTEQLLRRMAKD